MNYRSLSPSSVVVVPAYIFHKSLCHYLLLYRFKIKKDVSKN